MSAPASRYVPARSLPGRGRSAALVALLSAAAVAGCVSPAAATQPAAGATAAAAPPAPQHNGAIAFVRGGDIYTVAADGTALQRLTHLGTATRPVWSPDGTRLAFVSTGYVWTMSATGTDLVKAFPGYAPSWSPDGTHLAYVATDADLHGDIREFMCGATAAVVTRALSGGGEHVLAYDDFSCSGFPPTHRSFAGATTSWSASGNHVLFGDTVPDGRVNGSIYRGASSVDDFDLTAPYTCGGSSCRWPPPGFSVLARFRPSKTPQVDYAPAGSSFVFTGSPRSAGGSTYLYVGNRSGTSRQQLTADTDVSSPRYSPDGRLVLYTRHSASGTVVKRAEVGSTAPATVLIRDAAQADQQPVP